MPGSRAVKPAQALSYRTSWPCSSGTYAAVKAALTFPWSNGPVEGHINRLKLIKRSGYGRMQLDLLRQRVLYDAA